MCCISFHSSIVIFIILQISLLSIPRFIVFCNSYSSKYCFTYSMISIEIPCPICMLSNTLLCCHSFFISLIKSLQIIDFFLPFIFIPILFKSFYFQWLCSLSPISWNVVVYYSFTTDDNSPIIGMLFV